MIEVLRPGLCDLIMDQGRPGWGALGVPAGGAADPAALAAANRLVGNDENAAGLEIALVGPTLRFPKGGVAALTGARFAASRSSGATLAWDQTVVLAAGETLTLESAAAGCRCWLALGGGLSAPPLLGSRSTCLPAAFGGHRGRALRAGDALESAPQAGDVRLLRAWPPASAGQDASLRVLAGPQAARSADAGLLAFFSGVFHVSPAFDRRGVRLAGPPVRHAIAELPSQAVLPGAVQVPPDGQPIILGWDGPVTGGYPVIATVIAADLPKLAQLRSGDTVQFVTVGREQARALAEATWQIEELG